MAEDHITQENVSPIVADGGDIAKEVESVTFGGHEIDPQSKEDKRFTELYREINGKGGVEMLRVKYLGDPNAVAKFKKVIEERGLEGIDYQGLTGTYHSNYPQTGQEIDNSMLSEQEYLMFIATDEEFPDQWV